MPILIFGLGLFLNGCSNVSKADMAVKLQFEENEGTIIQQQQLICEQEKLIAENEAILKDLEVKLENLKLEETKYFIIKELRSSYSLHYIETELSGVLSLSSYSAFLENYIMKPKNVKYFAIGKYTTNMDSISLKDIDIDKTNQRITLTLAKPSIYSIEFENKENCDNLPNNTVMLKNLKMKDTYISALKNEIKFLLKQEMYEWSFYNKNIFDFEEKLKQKIKSLTETSSYCDYIVEIQFK